MLHRCVYREFIQSCFISDLPFPDVVPDNLSRLPPGTSVAGGASAYVAGRFTATPALRVAESQVPPPSSSADSPAGAAANLARSVPVSVPLPEKASRLPDLPPEIDQV